MRGGHDGRGGGGASDKTATGRSRCRGGERRLDRGALKTRLPKIKDMEINAARLGATTRLANAIQRRRAQGRQSTIIMTRTAVYTIRADLAMNILITLLRFFCEIYSIFVINSFCILHCMHEENNFYIRSFIESILFL